LPAVFPRICALLCWLETHGPGRRCHHGQIGIQNINAGDFMAVSEDIQRSTARLVERAPVS
jgi:hypothetical protein